MLTFSLIDTIDICHKYIDHSTRFILMSAQFILILYENVIGH